MSVEVFPSRPSERKELPSAGGRSEEEYAFSPFLTNNGVRISPGHMLFDNAYDGKHYEQKMTIQNCGDHLVLVRLGEPTSSSFKFRPFKEGKYLSPGMNITRTVKYSYNAALAVQKGFTTIWVNDDEIRYYFVVVVATAVLSIEPRQLDFGRINAVNYAMTRTFYIKNSGFKGSQFAIDLGRNTLEMIVEPMKGIVPAKGSVAITVEVVGTKEGEFVEEFWVKTAPPQRVVIQDFTLIDFQPTYYGSRSTEPLLIKNFSSSPSMFCVMAEIKGTTMTLNEARKIDDNYNNFIIKPTDGRLAALKGAIIQITFAPTHPKGKEKNYAACFLKIVRMDCRDVESADGFYDYRDSLVKPSTTEFDTTSNPRESLIATDNTVISLMSIAEDEPAPTPEDTFSFEHSIGVCLHGEKEVASLSLRPTIFILKELTLGKVYQREMLVTNKSKKLAVRVRYQKVIAMEVVPSEFDLEPGGSTEVLVTIRTIKLDRMEKKLILELLAIDRPNDSRTIYRKVGSSSLRVIFEANNLVQKARSDQCVLCNELLPLQLEPEFPYRLSGTELAKKLQNDQVYLNYIRSLQELSAKEDKECSDYDLTFPTPLKYGGKCQDIVLLKKKQKNYTAFYPIPPILLYNVKIKPKSLKLQKVAAYTTLLDFFEIENRNIFPIYVLLKASKPYLVFTNCRHVIASKENRKIYFSFSTSNVGRYYINISILVNGCTVFIITVVAQAVPKTLKIETNTIEFTESSGNYKFFKVINALNAYTSFDWEIPSRNFKIYPQEGGIKAESFIMCMVAFRYEPSEPFTCECVLTSESGQKRLVKVVYKEREPVVAFDTYELNLHFIPLNTHIRRKITLKNLRTSPTWFIVRNIAPIPGILVEPHEGIVDGLDSQVFIINIHLRAVVIFSTEIVVCINDEEDITIELKGDVEYPQISLFPHSLFFRKIAPYSFDTLTFQIGNLSNCEIYITFPLEEFPEFTINEHADDLYSHEENIVLQPNQTRSLYLHFYPQYVSTYVFYLPYTINGILGPAHIKRGLSTTSNFFLKDSGQSYQQKLGLTFKTIPRGVPVIRINSSALEKTLEFSSLKINLTFYGADNPYNVSMTDFEISNVSTEVVEVCIRTDELQDPFALNSTSGANVDVYDVSYRIRLEPNDIAVFEVEFFPLNLGTYVTTLPIFVRGYYDNRIFNYLTLRGVYENPTIVPTVENCNFEPVPLRVRNEYYLTFHLRNHFEDCEVSMMPDVYALCAKVIKIRRLDARTEVDFVLWYDCSEVLCFDTTVTFRCTCDSYCTVRMTGVVETSLVTSHAFCQMLRENDVSKFLRKKPNYPELEGSKTNRILFNDNETCYPLFPKDSDTSWYGVYMRKVQKVLENWLFTQVFYKKNYCRIPEGFSDSCKVGESARKKKFGGYIKPKLRDLPLLELIANVCGNAVRNELAPSAPQELDYLAWFRYICYANSNVLNYLRRYSIYLPHVESKLLLNYDHYTLHEKTKRPREKLMEESIFYRLSKQCWIDLMLQIFKTFFLARIVCPPRQPILLAVESQIRFKQRQSLSMLSKLSDEELEVILDPGICGKHAQELQEWVKNIYDEEKEKLWSSIPPEKELNSLDLELRDGVVLGAITAHFCPYMRDDIRNMYTNPGNPVEIFHNVCVLINTWQKLKLSYEFSPLWMEKCTMLEMLILCTYLYTVLPNYYPQEKITIHAPLTQTESQTIDLQNLGKDIIRYRICFIGNENNLFRIGLNYVFVEPKRQKAVKIKYHAKSFKTTQATLIFSGETAGYKYAKTFVVTLIGQADVTYACMTIPINTDLYRPCNLTLNLESPFKVRAEYSVLFGIQHEGQCGDALYPWEVLRNLKTVREFTFQEDMWQFDDEGRCLLSQIFCCLDKGPRTLSLCFTNPVVGDWSVKFVNKGLVNSTCFEDIFVRVPENYKNRVCKCRKKASVANNCPKIIKVKFPMKNNPLWTARKKMVLMNVGDDELKFWNKLLFTPTGTRILKLIFNSETHPLSKRIEDSTNYIVELDKHSPFVTLRRIFIEDIISDDYFDVPIHPVKDLEQVSNVAMRLTSEDRLETRFYRLVFEHPTRSSENITENLQ